MNFSIISNQKDTCSLERARVEAIKCISEVKEEEREWDLSIFGTIVERFYQFVLEQKQTQGISFLFL